MSELKGFINRDEIIKNREMIADLERELNELTDQDHGVIQDLERKLENTILAIKGSFISQYRKMCIDTELGSLDSKILNDRERIEKLEQWKAGHATRHQNFKMKINLLESKIAELGDNLQKCGIKWDFRLDELNGFITELKERLDRGDKTE